MNRRAAFNHNKNEETAAFLVGSCRLAQFPNMPGNVYHVCGEHSRKLCESICIKAARFTSRRFQAVHWFECFRCTPEVIQSRLDAENFLISQHLGKILGFSENCIEETWIFLLISREAYRRLRVTCIFKLKKRLTFFLFEALVEEKMKSNFELQIERHTFMTFYRLKNVEFERVVGSRWWRVFGKWPGSERIGTFSSLFGEA